MRLFSLLRKSSSLSDCVKVGFMLIINLLPGRTRAEEVVKPAWDELTEVKIVSSIDGTEQPSLYWTPEKIGAEPRPLLICLHTWSGDYTQNNSAWLNEAVHRGWLFIHPNFRGMNNTPAACGSKLARQDILDACAWMQSHFPVDKSRIYIAGTSGGGHMTMLMAGHHPDSFSGASAWVGISDIAEWYRFHTKEGQPDDYAQHILDALGGPPGSSKSIDADYRDRSPIFHLDRAVGLPLDISAGVMDGHTGSVPIQHSLLAYNVLAKKQKLPTISEEEIEQLWVNHQLTDPTSSDRGIDDVYEREIFLRRKAGKTRITIFDGGHEGLPHAACEWLAQQQRETKSK
ncbi:MAG: prolyl oligopeptidase family serine peptidase [Planctomycetota bacterium]|nr:prolyl oligopeptidase family serine peptidase [Planctomycetota bacterium]MDA1214274.1 prolyl oligopeptidase family serine peptidase [Planctomycetota bacterium]